MSYLQDVQQMIVEAQQTGKVLMVGSAEELKLLKPFCKTAGVKLFTSRRVMAGSPQLWTTATTP